MIKTEYQHPPRVPLISSTAAVKHITVKIKSEALVEAPLEHSHDTRYSKKKSEQRVNEDSP